MTRPIRSFIALPLEPEIQQRLKIIQNELHRTGAEVKWVKAEQIHVTLKFLGEIESERLGTVKQILGQTISPLKEFLLEIDHLGAFPKLENPKIIWVGAKSPGSVIQKMGSSLEEALEKAGFPKEERDFAPHITIGRLKGSLNRFALTQAMKKFTFHEPLVQLVKEVTLFQSTLLPQGPVYEALDVIQLKAG